LSRSIGLFIICVGMAFAQPREKSPTFETASVKPSDPAKPESFWNMSPGRLTVRNMSLKSLVMAAYSVKQYQVTGGPKWVDSDRFDILAKLEGGGDNPRGKEAAMRLLAAAQALLAERFQLVFHNETRSVSGYSLVTAKGGIKLKQAEGDGSGSIHTSSTKVQASGYSMERLAASLSTQLDGPVVDATGVKGTFDFTLEWSADDGGPSLFTAIQETLGLKLEGRRVQVTIILIDRAEKPAAN
jgi:bla regulator protein BlaR1